MPDIDPDIAVSGRPTLSLVDPDVDMSAETAKAPPRAAWDTTRDLLLALPRVTRRSFAVDADLAGVDLRQVRRLAIPVAWDPYGVDGKDMTPEWELSIAIEKALASVVRSAREADPWRYLPPPIVPGGGACVCVTFDGVPIGVHGQWNKAIKRYVVMFEAVIEERKVVRAGASSA
jgi:hypothetical protein